MSRHSEMGDNRRRVICRLVFLFLCALPTASVLYYLLHRPGPVEWQNQIFAQLGIRVEIASIETPSPHVTILRGVKIPQLVGGDSNDPELDRYELVLEEIQIDTSTDTNVVTILQPFEIPTDALTKVLERCTDQMEHADIGRRLWQFEFGKISLTDRQSDVADFVMAPATLLVGCIETPDEPGTESVCARLLTRSTYHHHNRRTENDGDVLKIQFQQKAEGDRIQITTGTGFVPCRLFRYWQKAIGSLGNRSVFQGTIDLLVTGDEQVWGTIDGKLAEVELDRVSAPFSLGIRGICDLPDFNLRLENSQIESARFHIDSKQPVTIGTGLLAAAGVLGITTVANENQIDYSFPILDFIINIEGGGMTLSGTKDSTIAMDSQGKVLAKCVNGHNIPLYQLAALMTGENTIGSQAIEFLNRFRIPNPDRTASNETNSRF